MIGRAEGRITAVFCQPLPLWSKRTTRIYKSDRILSKIVQREDSSEAIMRKEMPQLTCLIAKTLTEATILARGKVGLDERTSRKSKR